MLQSKSSDAKYSVSKWVKHSALLDIDEMKGCLEALGSFEFYNVSSIAPLEHLKIARQAFLQSYRDYMEALKEGKILEPDRKIFSSIMTVDPETLYAQEIQPGRWMMKLAKPALQLQNHRFFASQIDYQMHPMVMSPDSIQWGIQFAFPQIFYDGSTSGYLKTGDEKQFPNAALFSRLVKWLRSESVPTTFVWKGMRISTPFRIGKACFAWIANHPQLKAQGIGVYVY